MDLLWNPDSGQRSAWQRTGPRFITEIQNKKVLPTTRLPVSQYNNTRIEKKKDARLQLFLLLGPFFVVICANLASMFLPPTAPSKKQTT